MEFRVQCTWEQGVCSRDKLCTGMTPLPRIRNRSLGKAKVCALHGCVALAREGSRRRRPAKGGRKRHRLRTEPTLPFPFSAWRTSKKALKVRRLIHI